MRDILVEWKKFLKEQEALDLPRPDQRGETTVNVVPPSSTTENPKITKWLNNLTKPAETGILSPPFRVRLSSGKLSENPIDYPTENEIKKDPRFCPTSDWVPLERKGYRSVKEINGWFLHLFFDNRGNMLLKQIGDKKGDHNSKTHGSHYDYFGAMKKDMFGGCSILSYLQPSLIGHAGEYLGSIAKDIIKK